MKQLISNYSYNTVAKTVTLTDFTTVRLDRLQLITNTTTNAIIYNFADSSVATATVAGNVITLSAAPGSNTDKLMVIYDAASGDPTYDGYRELAGLTAGALNADLVPSTDVSAYKYGSIHTAGTWSGVITVQASNDNTNWVTVVIQNNTANPGGVINSFTTNAVYNFAITTRYLRIRMTSYTSGTATGVLELFTTPVTMTSQNVGAQQSGNWAVGANSATAAAVPTNAFFMGIANSTNLLTGVSAISNVADANNGNATVSTGGMVYNGTNFDRQRSATSASGTTGTGIPAAGMLGHDGTNYQRIKTDTAGNQLIAGSYTEVPFSTTTVQAVGTTDVSSYSHVSVQIAAQGTSSNIIFQGSNDNSNWVSVAMQSVASGQTFTTSSGGVGVFAGTLAYRYFRLNVTGISAGTTSGTIEFANKPFMAASSNVFQSGTWSVGSNSATGSAVPANAFYMAGTLSAGTLSGLRLDDFGDGTNGANAAMVSQRIYNGTNFDRIRSATSAAGTTGTGVPAAGMLGFDGTNYQRLTVSTGGKAYVLLQDGFANTLAQITPGDALSAAPTTALGVTSHNLVYNGTNHVRMRGDTTGTYTVSRPTTSGGVTVAKIASAATTNATSVKASAGQVYGWSLFNTSAATKYFKFYNKATAPTVGTDTPVFIVPIPPSASVSIMLGDLGTPLATGIAYAITGAVADTDTTAVALNDVVGSVFYS